MRKYKTKRVFINSFLDSQNSDNSPYSLSKGEPRECYNLLSKSGTLRTSLGIKHLSLPASRTSSTLFERNGLPDGVTFRKLWRYKYYANSSSRYEYFLVGFGSDGYLYYNNLFFPDLNYHQIETASFTALDIDALMFRANGQDVIGFVSSDDDTLIWYAENDPYTVDSIPRVTSISLHNNRLYAIDGSEMFVKYSSMTNLLDWTSSMTGGGEIYPNDYKEQLKKIVSFKDNLYVFGEHGITKIQSYVAGTTYTTSNIFATTEKIYKNSICICGSRIYFLTTGGLYFFNGFDTFKVDLGIDDMLCSVKQDSVCSAYYGGKLYLACHLPYSDQTQAEEAMANNCLVELNPENSKIRIVRGFDTKSMLAVSDYNVDKLILVLNGSGYLWELTTDGKLSGSSLTKVWRSGKMVVDNFDKDKILKKVYLTGSGEMEVTLTSDKTSKKVSLDTTLSTTRRVVNIVGREFEVLIKSSDEDFSVEKMELLFEAEE